jgi:hypothetical protein
LGDEERVKWVAARRWVVRVRCGEEEDALEELFGERV